MGIYFATLNIAHNCQKISLETHNGISYDLSMETKEYRTELLRLMDKAMSVGDIKTYSNLSLLYQESIQEIPACKRETK